MPRSGFFFRLPSVCLAAISLAALCLTAADAPAPSYGYREGVWASYRVTASPERLYFTPLPENDPGAPTAQEFTCTFTVRRHDAGKTLLALRISQPDLPPLEELLIDSFPLERLLAPDVGSRNLEVTSGQPAEFVVPAAADRAEETLPATRITLIGAGQKLEVWKSAAVPFGILQVSCEGFRLTLTGYGW